MSEALRENEDEYKGLDATSNPFWEAFVEKRIKELEGLQDVGFSVEVGEAKSTLTLTFGEKSENVEADNHIPPQRFETILHRALSDLGVKL